MPCAPRRASSILSASPAMVGSSKRLSRGNSTWKTSRTRETSWVARKEWPPSSKKSSCANPRDA